MQDGAFPLVRNIVATSSMDEGFGDVDYALLVGSKPRTKGMERGDLLKVQGIVVAGKGGWGGSA